MADERRITIANTSGARIPVIVNCREAHCNTIDHLPGSQVDASLREFARLVIDEVENVAVFGQDAVRLNPDN